MVDLVELLEAKNRVADVLMGNTGKTVGVGLSETNDTVNVYARQFDDKSIQHIRNQVGTKTDGKEIVIIPTGDVRALQYNNINRTSYSRPIYGGMSISHRLVTAGTYGCMVYDAKTKSPMALSNAHVLANSSLASNPTAFIGDEVFSPGCIDTSGCQYKFGSLTRFIPLQEGVYNFVDCAVSSPDNINDITSNIIGVGEPQGYEAPKEKMKVVKSGRSSGVTYSEIIDTHASMEVSYGNSIIRFANCVVTSANAIGGDSGSALVNTDTKKVVSLLFAGSDTITVYNNIEYVLSALDVTITPSESVPQPQYTTINGTSEYQAQSLAYLGVGIYGIVALLPAINEQIQLAIHRKI